jgi:hypothetical protein
VDSIYVFPYPRVQMVAAGLPVVSTRLRALAAFVGDTIRRRLGRVPIDKEDEA